MLIGRVTGNVVATRKHSSHEGAKILVIQPLDVHGEPSGDALLALDGGRGIDAGPGDRVLVVQEGWSAATVIGPGGQPIDAAVVGVVDSVQVDDAGRP